MNDASFPEFRLDQLKVFAKRWAEKYPAPGIERIILYRYNTIYQERIREKFQGKWPITKYAVVFEYSGCYNISEKEIDSYPNSDDDECTTFIKQVKFAGQYGGAHPFLSADFERRVYKERLAKDYRREWTFFPKRTDEKLSLIILSNEPYEVIYPETDEALEHAADHKVRSCNENEKKHAPKTSAPTRFEFVNKGDFWHVRFKDEELLVKDRLRLHCVVHLLDNPGKPMNANYLMSLTKGLEPEAEEELDSRKFEEEGMNLSNLYVDEFDEEQKKRFEDYMYNEFEKLKKAKKNSSEGYKKSLKEWNAFRRHMLSACGVSVSVSGNDIKFTYKMRPVKTMDDARKAASVHVKRVIEDLEKEMPLLASHLRRYINTGVECSYVPDPAEEVNWLIQWSIKS